MLRDIAHAAMLDKGLQPDFSPAALAECNGIPGPAAESDKSIRDLTSLLWCSIDNDDSRDLDQLTVSRPEQNGALTILVAIADVDALVKKGSALDEHAQQNTTSVYTPAEIFPMLPERLSTDLTSLNFASDRLAVVVEMTFDPGGVLGSSVIYRAKVRNKAKLAYNSVGDWFEGRGPIPAAAGKVPGLDADLRRQDHLAQRLREMRHQVGALDFETIETEPIFSGDELARLDLERRGRAKELIEEFMVAANGVGARFLATHNVPSIRRVVRTPRRWEMIVELAAEHGARLPGEPDSKALEKFLVTERDKDPLRFPDLSLSVIKLMGAGEYVVEVPGQPAAGHFGLAVKDYAHSTAPNRRYPDVLTQRLLKSVLTGARVPYDNDELSGLAQHCTEAEDAAKKVERQVQKAAAALLLQSRVGEKFEALVTGASEKGTWVRILHPPVEGKLISGFQGVKVGQRLHVQLVHTNAERGYIDFRRS